MLHINSSVGTAAQKSSKCSLIQRPAIILAMLLLCAVFSGCTDSFGDNYKYDWVVKTTYTNGDIDTLNCSYNSFKGNECYLYLKVSESGLLSSGGTTPCLIVGCGFRQQVVSCDIRKYEVLSLSKVSLK
jgi:hypothetical protein